MSNNKHLIVVSRHAIDGVCKDGQRMFVTRTADCFYLHVGGTRRDKVTRKYIREHFDVVQEGV